MPGAVRSLIVGGGIRAGSPATLQTVPIFAGATPPDLLVDGNLRQDGTFVPPRVFIGDQGATVTPGATVLGGARTNLVAGKSIIIGDNAAFLPGAFTFGGIVIGRNASLTSFGDGGLVIGDGAVGTPTNGDIVLIGRGASTNRDSVVVIGSGANYTIGLVGVAIGFNASVSAGQNNTVVGASSVISGGAGAGGATVIGAVNSTNKARNILLGTSLNESASPAGDCCIIGVTYTSTATLPSNTVLFANSSGYTTFIVGKGDVHAAPQSLLFRLTDGVGANIVGGTLTLRGGQGTGNAVGSKIVLQTTTVLGAGAVAQPIVPVLTIQQTGGLAGQAGVRFDTVFNGAGAAAGTLLNAPLAGDPTFWLPVDIAGIVRHIPCW